MGALQKLWLLPFISGIVILIALLVLLKMTQWITVFDGCMVFLSVAMFILMMLLFFWFVAGDLIDNVVIEEGRKLVAQYPFIRSIFNMSLSELNDMNNVRQDQMQPLQNLSKVSKDLSQPIQDLSKVSNDLLQLGQDLSKVTQADYNQSATAVSKANGKLLFVGLPGFCMYACFAIAAAFLCWNIWRNITQGSPAIKGNEAISMSLTLIVFVIEIYIFFVIIQNIPTPTAIQFVQSLVDLIPGSFAHELKYLWDKSVKDNLSSYSSLTAAEKEEGAALAASIETSSNDSLPKTILKQYVYSRLSSSDVILLIVVSILAVVVAGLVLTKSVFVGRIDILITTLTTFALILVFQVTFICFIILSMSSKNPFKTIATSPGGQNLVLFKILQQ